MRHHSAKGPTDEVVTPKSSVHILKTDEELRAAVVRACEFDNRTSERLQTRSQQYRLLVQNRLHALETGNGLTESGVGVEFPGLGGPDSDEDTRE